MLLRVSIIDNRIVKKRVQLEKIPNKYRKGVERRLWLISKAIQTRRDELKLTQEGLAERLEISSITIQFIEQGRRYPSLPMLFYICEYLRIKVEIS